MPHEDEEHTRVWKDKLVETFGVGEPNEEGEAQLHIDLTNAVDAIQTIERMASALIGYFLDDLNIPEPAVAHHLAQIRGEADDLYFYLVDEGDHG